MSTDGLLPPLFSRVSKRTQTPYVSTIITGVMAAIIGGTRVYQALPPLPCRALPIRVPSAGLLPIDLLGEMVSIGTLLAFVLVCAGG